MKPNTMGMIHVEQLRINQETARALTAVKESESEWDEVRAACDQLFDLLEDFEKIYRTASDAEKRRLNVALYRKLLVDSDKDIVAEMNRPVDPAQPARYFRRAAIASPKFRRHRHPGWSKQKNEPTPVLVGVGSNIDCRGSVPVSRNGSGSYATPEDLLGLPLG
jgi:hypothetical protein